MSPLHFLSFCIYVTIFVPAPGNSVLGTWLDLMTRCEGTCYYYPVPQTPPDLSALDPPPPGGIGQKNHECKYFVYGSKGRMDSNGVFHPPSPVPCRYVVSIQPYIPTCDTFDRQPLNDRLCEYFKFHPDTSLYLITVAQKFKVEGCNMLESRNPPFTVPAYMAELAKDPARDGTCNVWDENVAFTLSTTRKTNFGDLDMVADKIYYVCTNEGLTAYPYDNGYPTLDENGFPVAPKSERITLAAPYADSPPGILWSDVQKPKGERTIICSFVLSTDKFAYRKSTWEVGVIGGREVARHEILPGTLRPQFIHYDENANALWLKVGTAKIKRYYYANEADFLVPDEETLFRDRRIYTKWITRLRIDDLGRSADTLNLKTLVPSNSFRKLDVPIDPVLNTQILRKIDSIYASCRDKTALCYNFPWEEGCQSREKCHMLVVIEQYFNFERLHIDMLTHPNFPHPVVMPYSFGWMGVAFSNDASMGGESVFTCSYKGRSGNCADPPSRREDPTSDTENDPRRNDCSKIYITINLDHPFQRGRERNNYYSENAFDIKLGDYQNLIENAMVNYAVVPSESQPRVLCSFDFRTGDYTNISAYPLRPNEILQYDLLNKEYFVLMATGRALIGNWRIGYHGRESRASGASMKYSRKIYEDTIKSTGAPLHTHK